MSVAPDRVAKKEHKKKRRKREEGDDGQPRRKRSKIEDPNAEAAAERSGQDFESRDFGDPQPLIVQDDGPFHKESSKHNKPESPDRAKLHKKRKKNRKLYEEENNNDKDRDSVVVPPLSATIFQDAEELRKKRDKHGAHQNGAKSHWEREGDIAGYSIPTATALESYGNLSKAERKLKAVARDPGSSELRSQQNGTAEESQRHESTVHDQENRRKKKKEKKTKDKHPVVGINAEEDEVLSHGSEPTTQAQLFAPTSRDQEALRKTGKRKNIDGDVLRDHPNDSITTTKLPIPISQDQEPPLKEKKQKDGVRDKLQNQPSRSPEPPVTVSRGGESPPKKRPKIKNKSSNPKPESLRRQLDDTPDAQDLSSTRLPALDPSSPSASPLHLQTSSLYLPLAPISQLHPLAGLCAEHLSPLLLTYYTPFRGVILSYHNPRLGNRPPVSGYQQDYQDTNELVLATSIDEYAAPFVWVTAEFLVFRPKAGTLIEGWVNLQNEGHIGLVCWNLFSASVGRNRIPKGWRWVKGGWDFGARRQKGVATEGGTASQDWEMDDDEGEDDEGAEGENLGHFEDERGKEIEGALTFRVKRVEVQRTWDREKGERSFISLEGSLLTVEEEEKAKEKAVRGKRKVGMGNEENSMSGAGGREGTERDSD